MNEKNVQRLKAEFPLMFRNIDQYGIATRDGWFELIFNLTANVEAVCKRHGITNEGTPYVVQIKEKFGTLRYSLRWDSETPEKVTAAIRELREIADQESSRTCERCGKPGRMYSDGPYMVRCKTCYENEETLRIIEWSEWVKR
jgi:hypothetical protein